MEFKVVIGLEVHCQLNTASKIFAGDANVFGTEPNENISVITLAHPGVLPKLNKEVVNSAIKLGLAFDCEINQVNFFDRKNYFYPDLPKGYQVSQDKRPICLGGEVKFLLKKGKEYEQSSVKIHHIHMEEDAGKSIHDLDARNTMLDYNRAGTPLLEIVSEPCIESPEAAAAYLTEIRKIVRYLGISDGNMEEGSLRADLNVSLMLKDAKELGTKVEIKNMNSIRFLQKAAEYEIERQAKMLRAGEKIIQETRSFDPSTGTTAGMRVKETMNDYRYFPEPDLAPIIITDEMLNSFVMAMPKMPQAYFEEFKSAAYGLSAENAYQITEDADTINYFVEVCQHSQNRKAVSNWVLGNVKGYLNENKLEIKDLNLKPFKLASLINLIDEGKISNLAAQSLMNMLMADADADLLGLAASNGLLIADNKDELSGWINEVLEAQKEKVAEYKKGKKGLIGMFVGEVMKKTKGSGDPKKINELLTEILK